MGKCECRHDHPDSSKQLDVYSRIVGYLRPVSQWNLGKQEEFKARKEFKIRKLELSKT